MTEPLVKADVDLSGMAFMPLDVQRLLDSELWLTGTGEECKAAVSLWCKAWQQRPAASLPENDRLLAAYSGAGPRWKKVKDMALHGFVKCSDGRYYHPVIAEKANEAWGERLAYRERAAKARAVKAANKETVKEPEKEAVTATDTVSVTEPVKDFTTDLKDKGKGQSKGQGQGQSPLPPLRQASGGSAYVPIGAVAWSDKGPSSTDPDGIHVAWTFHKCRETHFGNAPPPFLRSDEISICQGWVDRGVGYERCRELMDERMRRMAEKGESPPGSIKFFDRAIGEIAGRAA